MKKFFLVAILLIMTQLAVQAQYNPNLPRNNSGTANDDVPDDFGDNGKFSWQRVFTGGGLGVQFGNVTNVSLSPLVGYHFTNRFSAGASFAYNYFRDGRSSLVYKYNLWGPGAFARYRVFRQFSLHAEIQQLFYKESIANSNYSFSGSQTRLPIGAIVQQRLAGRSYFVLEVLYDVLHNQNSIYSTPLIFRGGVNIGF